MSKAYEETKRYLGQIRFLDNVIENRLRERSRLRDKITSISSEMSGDRVQSSGSKDRIGDSVSKLVDLEREIDGLIDRYIDKKRVISSQLESLSNPDYYQILYLRYVDRKSFCEISCAVNRPERTVKRIHNNGMTEFESRFGMTYMKKSRKKS